MNTTTPKEAPATIETTGHGPDATIWVLMPNTERIGPFESVSEALTYLQALRASL